MKKLFKYRHWDLWRFDFYLFQEGKWEVGISFDINGYPLLSIQLLFFFIEFNFMKGFKEWKNPNYTKELKEVEKILFDKIFGNKEEKDYKYYKEIEILKRRYNDLDSKVNKEET